MTGIRWGIVLLVAVGSMAFVGCGGGAGGDNPGGNEAGNGGGGEGGVEEGGESVQDVDGTWIGSAASTEYQATMMLDLDQDGQQVTGHSTVAYDGNEETTYLLDLSGRAASEDKVSLVYEREDESLNIEGNITAPDTMDIAMSYSDGSENFVLQRVQTQQPEEMGLATVQSVYNRDWPWFADRVSDEFEDNLEYSYADDIESDEYWSDLSQMASLDYKREMSNVDEEDEPTLGAEVMLNEESVVFGETPSAQTVEFDYETTAGENGDAKVWLQQAGTAGSGYSFKIYAIEIDGETYELSVS